MDLVESGKYKLIDEDRIPIYTRKFDGDDGFMWYAISESNVGDVNLKKHIAIDEDDSAYLLEDLFDHYFDEKYNHDSDIPTDEFNHWRNNFYLLCIVDKILNELEEVIKLLNVDPYNRRIGEIVDLNKAIKAYRNISLRVCYDEALPIEEKLTYMMPKRAVLIDFYSKFVVCVRKMVYENPQAKFFVVSGP